MRRHSSERCIVLRSCSGALSEAYDLAMLDLDGVVYIGGHAVSGAPDAIASARKAGMHVAFVTNNAARPPQEVAAHLSELGIEASAEDVVTSAQAAAAVLRERHGAGARIAALGAVGLFEALEAAGLKVVGVDAPAEAAVTGYGPDVPWRDIMRLATRIRGGLPWVASNTDGSIPTPYGEAPGHGVLVEMLSRFAGVTPEVGGKPAPPLLRETIRRVGGERPLMVGDRLDTDIAGGIAVGVDTLLVMTGVTGLAELVAVPADLRPSYIAADLRGLTSSQPSVSVAGGRCALGGWEISVAASGSLSVAGGGSLDDWWRAVAAAAWSYLDTTGAAVDASHVTPPR